MQDNLLMTLGTIILALWYGIIRWIILAKSNATSWDWLQNPLGNTVVVISIAYLTYALTAYNPEYKLFFMIITIGLCVINGYFVYLMERIFVNQENNANFWYLMLDCYIFLYYLGMSYLCIKSHIH